MRLTVRIVATGLALVFACYFSARALWWTSPPPRPLLVLLAVLIYLVSFAVIAIVGAARAVKMPRWAAALALASAIAIPQLSNLGLDPAALRAPYATWYIGSVGLIGVVCIVRRRPLAGWLVLLLLTIASTLWIGILDSLGLGLVGSTVWMVIAQLLVAFWRRAVRDTDRLAGIQQAASAWQATQIVRQRERRERVQYALAVAGPILARVIATRGDLSVEERQEAHLSEGRLRDEIRGGELLNERASGDRDGAREGRHGDRVRRRRAGGPRRADQGADPRGAGGRARGLVLRAAHHPRPEGCADRGHRGRTLRGGGVLGRGLRRAVARDRALARGVISRTPAQ